MTPQQLVQRLGLQPHPEGGFYRETYRSPLPVQRPDGAQRAASTAIYYLLCNGAHSAWHRIRADEIWHFYSGSSLLIHEIAAGGVLHTHRLGAEPGAAFQAVVAAGHWFAAELADPKTFALVGCTVAPGFEFNEFELADSAALQQRHPDHAALIARLGASRS